MLAWLHQAIASEKELLHSLLRHSTSSMCERLYFFKTEFVIEVTYQTLSFTADEQTQKEILSHITEGVCRPFKVGSDRHFFVCNAQEVQPGRLSFCVPPPPPPPLSNSPPPLP